MLNYWLGMGCETLWLVYESRMSGNEMMQTKTIAMLIVAMALSCVSTYGQQSRLDLSAFSPQEKMSIEATYNYDMVINGPAACNSCWRAQLNLLSPHESNN
jgi:hypothetical protein